MKRLTNINSRICYFILGIAFVYFAASPEVILSTCYCARVGIHTALRNEIVLGSVASGRLRDTGVLRVKLSTCKCEVSFSLNP